jgi:hypothetical protein
MKKELKLAGKGHNEIHKAINLLELTVSVAAAVKDHVPENRGARAHFTAEESSMSLAFRMASL